MDVLLRKLPDEDVAAADRQASARGVSRNSYLRQLIHEGVGSINRQLWLKTGGASLRQQPT